MGLIEDPKAQARSLMHAQKSLCNGQATGKNCVHYWAMSQKVESANPDFLKIGQIKRMCMISPGYPIEFISELELATRCNKYEACGIDYDPSFEEYNPMSPQEVKDLQQTEVDNTLGVASPTEQIKSLRAEIGLEAALDGAVSALNESK